MAKKVASDKSKTSKNSNDGGFSVFLTISNPQSGVDSIVKVMPGMQMGLLCAANGQAPFPDPGFTLSSISVLNAAGGNPPSASDIVQYGQVVQADSSRNWPAPPPASPMPSIMAYVGTNTFGVAYKYQKNNMPPMPPSFQTKTESVTYNAVSGNCPTTVRAGSLATSPQRVDIGPSKKTGNSYLYKSVNSKQGGLGFRLMRNRTHALHASEIQVAVVRTDWTPEARIELHLHRPIGSFESIPPIPGPPFDPQSYSYRFPSKHKHGIVLFQPSSKVAHTLVSQSLKQPDWFSVHNFLDIHVMVNDVDFADCYADNDGDYDLWVRVMKP